MKPGFLAPRGTLDKKPPHGQPCNRCGLCCVATICPLGQHVFNRERGPCPALSYDDAGLSKCGLVDDPMRFSMKTALRYGVETVRAASKLLIGAALGCDARFNGEKPDESFYAKLRAWDRKNAQAVRDAKRTWGMH